MVQQANGDQKEVCQYKDFTGSDLDSKQIKTVYVLIVIQTFGVQKVKTKYASFKDWTKYENKLVQAIKEGK